MNKTAKKAARKTCSALMLVVLAFLTTLPIFWCIITSLKTPQDISALSLIHISEPTRH